MIHDDIQAKNLTIEKIDHLNVVGCDIGDDPQDFHFTHPTTLVSYRFALYHTSANLLSLTDRACDRDRRNANFAHHQNPWPMPRRPEVLKGCSCRMRNFRPRDAPYFLRTDGWSSSARCAASASPTRTI